MLKLTERFIRHGNVLTDLTYTEDPVYLTEPLVKTTNMLLNPRPLNPQQLLYPCVAVVELPDQKRGAVPHFLPGQNQNLQEFRDQTGLPEMATCGGAETMYPEFQQKVKDAQAAVKPNPPAAPPPARR